MKRKTLKCVLYVVVIAFVCYNSIYFKKLSDVKNTANKSFDAVAFANKLWQEKFPTRMENAVELTSYVQQLQANPAKALDEHSNALAIGNYRYSLIKATATVTAINEDDMDLAIANNGSTINAKISTEFIYGNAIRDASKLVDVKDFTNSTDLNNISEAFNSKVKKEVLPSFKSSVQKGSKIEVIAAVELNKEHLKLDGWHLIPVKIQMIP